MIQRISERLHREDKGFTLIELMVVVLIIAILIAIAIPTFLGARGRAQDRAAQSSLRNAVTGAKAIFTDNETYEDATVDALQAAEPALQFTDDASVNPPNHVSVGGQTQFVFFAAAASANGDRCWHVRDAVDPDDNPGTWWALTTGDCEAPYGGTAFAADDGEDPAAGAWVRSPGNAVPAGGD